MINTPLKSIADYLLRVGEGKEPTYINENGLILDFIFLNNLLKKF